MMASQPFATPATHSWLCVATSHSCVFFLLILGTFSWSPLDTLPLTRNLRHFSFHAAAACLASSLSPDSRWVSLSVRTLGRTSGEQSRDPQGP